MQTRRHNFKALVLSIVFSAMFALPSYAAVTLTAVDGTDFNVKQSMAKNLQYYAGKKHKVALTLRSGNQLAGYIKAVGKTTVHVEKLTGKDYFDALIRIEDISAIDVRFRKIQR